MRGKAQPWVDCQASNPAKPFPIAAQAAVFAQQADLHSVASN
jgi:hypothetical protein